MKKVTGSRSWNAAIITSGELCAGPSQADRQSHGKRDPGDVTLKTDPKPTGADQWRVSRSAGRPRVRRYLSRPHAPALRSTPRPTIRDRPAARRVTLAVLPGPAPSPTMATTIHGASGGSSSLTMQPPSCRSSPRPSGRRCWPTVLGSIGAALIVSDLLLMRFSSPS
jgi:hypothetical protein